MMHTTTSHYYGILVFIEMTVAIVRGKPWRYLVQYSIKRALHFRKEVYRLLRQESEGWFFRYLAA